MPYKPKTGDLVRITHALGWKTEKEVLGIHMGPNEPEELLVEILTEEGTVVFIPIFRVFPVC